MNIWVDIGHVPQYNFYKNFILALSKKGYNVYVSVLKRARLPQIVQHELGDVPNVYIYPIGRHRLSKWSAIVETNLIRIPQLFIWSLGKHFDVAFSNHHQTSIAAHILHIPDYAFGDDTQTILYPWFVKLATKSHMLIYEDLTKTALQKDNIMPVLKEWAYLAPKYYRPNVSVLNKYGVKPKQYIFLREVTVGTMNYKDQKQGAILHVQDIIDSATYMNKYGASEKMQVIFSLEKKDTKNLYPKDWILLQEPIDDIHSLIYYSAGLISSGDSMAREAALLGVPSYYLGIRYSMPANAAASKVANLQNQKTMRLEEWIKTLDEYSETAEQRQNQLRKEIDSKFIDINAYMLNLVEDVKNKKNR